MRVTYLGQACTLIEAAGRTILTDPWLTEGAYCGTWFHTHVLEEAGVSPAALPKKIDYVFLSHEHEDHFDPETLRHLDRNVPVLICRFFTSKFRHQVEALGFQRVHELESGQTLDLGDDLRITIFGTAEYTNDSAILVEGDGCRVFNETDCKLSFADYERIGAKGIDLGFYMFSGANWFPMLYDYPAETQRDLVQRRRRSLIKGWVQRVKVMRPRVAVPAAGPCTVLDPELLWLNTEQRGIFIDPELAVAELTAAGLPVQPLYMAASDVWDSRKGFEPRAPAHFRGPRQQYIQDASERMAPLIRARRDAEPPAGSDLGEHLIRHFNTLVGIQTSAVRQRINAKLGVVVTGQQASMWTVDFTAPGSNYVREGLASDWTYKMEVEDKLLYRFLNGQMPFFEDLLLTLRVRLGRRPDVYNEPLYHFLYEADPEKLTNWYAKYRVS
jgi:UDP-MurNAc hydroxylase